MHRLLSGRLLIFLVLLFALQHAFSPLFEWIGGRVDFLYLAVLDYAFFQNWELVAFFALVVGLVRDFAGGHLFGIETASLTSSGVLLWLGMPKLERESPWVRYGLVFLFVLITEAIGFTLGSRLEAPGVSPGTLAVNLFVTTVGTTAAAPGFFWLTARWFRRTPSLKQYELFR